MSKEQIEEMARELREYGRTYDDDVMYGCDDLSEYLFVNKGYAKASDVAREIFGEIEKHYCINKFGDVYVHFDSIEEIKKKYTGEI